MSGAPGPAAEPTAGSAGPKTAEANPGTSRRAWEVFRGRVRDFYGPIRVRLIGLILLSPLYRWFS